MLGTPFILFLKFNNVQAHIVKAPQSQTIKVRKHNQIKLNNETQYDEKRNKRRPLTKKSILKKRKSDIALWNKALRLDLFAQKVTRLIKK